MKKQAFISLVIFTAILVVIFYEEISQAIRIVSYTIACLLVLSFLLIIGPLLWYAVERMKLLRARRIEAERQAHVMTITVGNQVFVRDTNQSANWRAMHLEARTYINSQDSEPSSPEIQRWQLFNAPQRSANKPTELPAPQSQVDLLAALNTAQCALIVGQRDSGKTTILQHVISRRLRVQKRITFTHLPLFAAHNATKV